MSLLANIIVDEWKMQRNQGAYERPMVYPEGSIVDGIPIISDTWLNKQAEEKEREELMKWDETVGSNDII